MERPGGAAWARVWYRWYAGSSELKDKRGTKTLWLLIWTYRTNWAQNVVHSLARTHTHLSWVCVSLCLLSSASLSSFLLWALAASSLAFARVNLRATASDVCAVAVLAVLLGAGPAGEDHVEMEVEEAALLTSSPCFFILWRRALRVAMSSWHRAWKDGGWLSWCSWWIQDNFLHLNRLNN